MNILRRKPILYVVLVVCSLLQVATVKEHSLTTRIGPRISQLQVRKRNVNQSDRRPDMRNGREVHIIRASDHQQHQAELDALLGQLNAETEGKLTEAFEEEADGLIEEDVFSFTSSTTTSPPIFESTTTSTTPRPKKEVLLEPSPIGNNWTSQIRLVIITFGSAITLVHLLIGPLRKCV